MKTRDEVYVCLQAFIYWVKPQVYVQHPYWVIISERAGECVGETWQSICRHTCAQYQYTSAGIHDESDVAERVWQTLQDSVRTMTCTPQFQKKKKTDVGLSTCSLVIQSYATQASWQVISPLEFVTGYKPDFSQVRIFGLKSYTFQFKDGWINLRTGSSSASMWVTPRK
jgi:hypothetical protein